LSYRTVVAKAGIEFEGRQRCRVTYESELDDVEFTLDGCANVGE